MVQKRTDIKDYCPGYWDPCTGGVLEQGEEYDLVCKKQKPTVRNKSKNSQKNNKKHSQYLRLQVATYMHSVAHMEHI